MPLTVTDFLSMSPRLQAKVERRYPDEAILFATAVTILETRQEHLVGWSMRRFFQRRGNVVVTDHRICAQSSFASFFTIFWFGLIAYCVNEYLQIRNSAALMLAGIATLLLIQRRPYWRDLPFEAIRRVEFGAVQGLTGRGDILSVVLEGRSVQFVTARSIPRDVRNTLESLGTASLESSPD